MMSCRKRCDERARRVLVQKTVTCDLIDETIVGLRVFHLFFTFSKSYFSSQQ